MALRELLDGLEGATEVLPNAAGPKGARVAARLVRAGEVTTEVSRRGRPRTPAARSVRVRHLAEGFEELVHALEEASTLEVDDAWADGRPAQDGAAGGADV